MTSQRGFYGWKLVFILWLLDFLNMGFPLYGGAVINTYMLKEIPMSRSAFGLGFTLLNLFVRPSPGTIGWVSERSRQWESVSAPSFPQRRLSRVGLAVIAEERWR